MTWFMVFKHWLLATLGVRQQAPAPQPQPEQEDPVIPQIPVQRPWTFMIYMAGDNGKIFDTKTGRIRLMAPMEEAGYQDLFEMGTVGTTATCAVTCLFDTPNATYKVEVRRGIRFSDSLVEPIPAVNTGDPNTLRDFIVSSIQSYPADHYLLVIWNHGTGWLDVDHYATVRAVEDDHKSWPAIFRTTYQKMTEGVTTRPIAFDDSSKDFLDTQDLRDAFKQAEDATGRRLDIIGMDACLMAMIEGAEELAPFADYFIGSQEVEPMAGWPYDRILTALNADPGLSPAALSDSIVTEFAKSYGARTRAMEETVTLSATALANAAPSVGLCRSLVAAILAHRDDATLKTLVRGCVRDTLVFQDKNYRDLGDFAAKLAVATDMTSYDDVKTAAQALSDALAGRDPAAPVLRVAYRSRYERATGLSVYLPSNEPGRALGIYRGLLFPQATGWDQLVDWIHNEF